jgi:NMD protein affecting ribosome stability and mRNA decay
MSFISFLNQARRAFSVTRCVDCNYYYIPKKYERGYGYNSTKCMRFINLDMKTRLSEFENAYIARGDKTMCGPDGKYFETQPKPPTIPN